MSSPNIYGGDNPAPDKQLKDPDASVRGVYANFPAATPKYNASNHIKARDETQARMYIDIPDPATYNRFLNAIPPEARRYANAMTRTLGDSGGKGYFDFFLVNASEPLREKVQVSEVLSDTHIAYFFGQAAPVWQYQIGLINSQQDEWYDAWNIVYENIIRGTRLAEARVAVTLAYDTRRVIGSVLQTQTGMTAQNEMAISGGFSILVKELQVAINVRDSPQDVLARELEAQRLAEVEEQLKQAKSTAMNKLAIQRQEELDGPGVSVLAAGVRPGHDPEEVRAKTGLKLLPHEEILQAGSRVVEAVSNVPSAVSAKTAEGALLLDKTGRKAVASVTDNVIAPILAAEKKVSDFVEVGVSRTFVGDIIEVVF